MLKSTKAKFGTTKKRMLWNRFVIFQMKWHSECVINYWHYIGHLKRCMRFIGIPTCASSIPKHIHHEHFQVENVPLSACIVVLPSVWIVNIRLTTVSLYNEPRSVHNPSSNTKLHRFAPKDSVRIEWDNNFSTILPPASNRCWTCKTFRFFWILDFLFCNSRAKHEQWTCDGYMYIFEWLLHASGKIGFQWFCLLRKHSLLSIMWLGNEIHCVKIHIFCCFD